MNGPRLDKVQTKREIERLLAQIGMRPRKRFGQHFLIDGNLMRRLVDAAELTPDDLVLEVGGGTGGLTDLLAGRARRVVCVEVDRDLQQLLMERFADRPDVTILAGDVLESKHRLHDGVAELLSRPPDGIRAVKLVANLPYQVATPLILNLLLDYPSVRRFCFTVQAEVGDRIMSAPNRKAYGPLSILAQTLCVAETIARMPPEAFWPRPTVDSIMLRMDVRDAREMDRQALHRFAAFVRGTFEHRRKTLRGALAYVVDEATRDRVCQEFDGQRRPESFSLAEWRAMFNLLSLVARRL